MTIEIKQSKRKSNRNMNAWQKQIVKLRHSSKGYTFSSVKELLHLILS